MEDTSLSDDDISDEGIASSARGQRTHSRHKNVQVREYERLQRDLKQMNGTIKKIHKGLDRLQRPHPSITTDEEYMPGKARPKPRGRKLMRKDKMYVSDNDNDDYQDNIPSLVNTLNILTNRLDTLNHRLETGQMFVHSHACCHEHCKYEADSASCSNTREFPDDNEYCTMESANYGTHGTIEGTLDTNMMDKRGIVVPQEIKHERKTPEPYFLPDSQTNPANILKQKTQTGDTGKLLSKPSSNGTHPTVFNDRKEVLVTEVQNKVDHSTSLKIIPVDSSGLKRVQTEPRDDNRKKDIKAERTFGIHKNAQLKRETLNNMNFVHGYKSKLKKTEDLQLKRQTKYLDGQKKETKSSMTSLEMPDHKNAEDNGVKIGRTDDQERQTEGRDAMSVPQTAQTVRRLDEPIMMLNEVPQEYWESVIQEAYVEAKKLETPISKRLHTIICLDTSMSMAEYWGDILEFLRNLIDEIYKVQAIDVKLVEHIAVVTFGLETCVLQHFTTNYQEMLTKLHLVKPEGSTPMYWGLSLCEAILYGSARSIRLHPRYLLITDGRPTYRFWTSGSDVPVKDCEEKVRVCAFRQSVLDLKRSINGTKGGTVPTDTKIIIKLEKEDAARELIRIKIRSPTFKVYPVAVGNNCDMEFLSAIADSCRGNIMNLSDWREIAHYGKKVEFASQYFHLAILSEQFLAQWIKERSGLPQEDIEFINKVIKDEVEHRNNEGTTSDEKKVVGSYQFPPVGSRVRRGPDWNRNDEDNDSPGTLVTYCKGEAYSGWVIVQWDKPKKYGRWRFRYRYGAESAYDITVQANEEPRVMKSRFNIIIGCEVVKGTYHESCDNEAFHVEEGTVGMVYNIKQMENGKYIAKVRWQNGKRLKYGERSLFVGEIEISPRSRPNLLPSLPNPHSGTNHPSMDISRQDLTRPKTLLPSQGRSSSRKHQCSEASSDSVAAWDREAFKIENVERYGMPAIDDMNSRNKILIRKQSANSTQSIGMTRTSSDSLKADRHKATEDAGSDVNSIRHGPKRSNKNDHV